MIPNSRGWTKRESRRNFRPWLRFRQFYPRLQQTWEVFLWLLKLISFLLTVNVQSVVRKPLRDLRLQLNRNELWPFVHIGHGAPVDQIHIENSLTFGLCVRLLNLLSSALKARSKQPQTKSEVTKTMIHKADCSGCCWGWGWSPASSLGLEDASSLSVSAIFSLKRLYFTL